MKKITLNFEKLLNLNTNFNIQTPILQISKLEINKKKLCLELQIEKTADIIGSAYDKYEQLEYSYKFGKKIYNILKSSVNSSIFPTIIKHRIFDITKISLTQKEKILFEFEKLLTECGLVILYPLNDNELSSITIPFFDENSSLNILEFSEKFVTLYFIYEFYKNISNLYDAITIYGEQPIYDKNLRKIEELVNLFFKNQFFINSKTQYEKIIGLQLLIMDFFLSVFPTLTLRFNISTRPYPIYTINNSFIILNSSDSFFDLSFCTIIEMYSLIFNQNPFTLINNKRFTCPICNKNKIKNGKRDIICSDCKKTPKGKKYIKNSHINNKKIRISKILSDFNNIDNPSTELTDKINKMKQLPINDHTPTISSLKLLQQEIDNYKK